MVLIMRGIETLMIVREGTADRKKKRGSTMLKTFDPLMKDGTKELRNGSSWREK